ncbi:MAG: protein kinase, partial [Chloroflexota bacterium]|nr:protein kinase [Chloroflexota bacterium]
MQSPVPFPSQEPVGGRYELLHRVGEGNFSITYRARDVILDRNVAVKVLREQFAADETFVSRFEREARVAASVSHPNVVDVYDFGPVGNTYYIAMQYVAGRTLKQELDARGRLPPPDAIRFATQILQGLAAIHAAGIVHRDIKPQNVLLGQDELARVTDFGVAHYPLQGALTTHGTTVGTASYMAPEQARGGALTEATDLYAVGVVLFELLTGRLPFEADNPMAVMLAHLQQPAPSLRDVAPELQLSPSLQSVVARALSKDPTARYPSADDMSEALAAAIAPNEATAATPFDAAEQTQTVQVPVVSAPAAAPTARAAASRGSANTVAPRTAMPSLPPVRRDQRAAGWLAPLLLFGLALIAGAGLLVSANGLPFGDGDGNGEDNPPAVAGVADATARPSAVSPEMTATAVPTPRSLRAVPIGEPTATAGTTGSSVAVPAADETRPPISTATMAPRQEPTLPPPTATMAPAASATSEPEPTATAPPAPTPTPSPVPTQTPEAEEVVPDPGVIAPADGEGSSTNPDGGIVPVEVDDPV